MSKRPKLIATDLDGTIVQHDGTITQRTIDTFKKAHAMGVEIFFVTGRPPRWMPEIKEAFGIGNAICGNGAMLYDFIKQEILEENMQRNAEYFDQEYDKLDKWADDMKISLEREIKDLDAEIKLRKAEARKKLDLQTKVKEQRAIKDLEKKRNEKRKHLFEAQDQIDGKKDDVLSNIEERLAQKLEEKELFTIQWKLI